MKLWTIHARGEALRHLEDNAEGSTNRNPDLEWADPLPLFAAAVELGLMIEAPQTEGPQLFRVVDVVREPEKQQQRWRVEVANLHPAYARVIANLLRAPGCESIAVSETDGEDGSTRELPLAVPYPRAARGIAPEFRYRPPDTQAIVRERSLRVVVTAGAIDPDILIADLDVWSELVWRSGFAPDGRDPSDSGTFPTGAYQYDPNTVGIDFEEVFMVDEAVFESPLRWAQRLCARGIGVAWLEVE